MTPINPLLGFYRVSSVTNGEHSKALWKHTNVAYIGGVDGGESDSSEEERIAGLKIHAKKLYKHGFHLIVDLEVGAGRLSMGQALKVFRPYWDKVTHIVLADENTELDYTILRNNALTKMAKLGLDSRPCGAVLMPDQLLTIAPARLAALDFIGIEAYHDLGNSDPRKQILARTKKIKQRFPNHKKLIVAQAYDRNGMFKDVPAMCRINSDTYNLLCKDDESVFAMVGFAYGRVGGTRDYPALQAVYEGIWKAMHE